MSDLYCPYCDAGLEVCHDDGFGYEEDRAHEMYCSECDKNFVFYTTISFDYHPERADCLNGHPHLFSDWKYLWKNDDNFLTTEIRRCRDCGHSERRQVKN
jgi:hypothetical protein